VVSNREQISYLLHQVDSPFNGLCFCTGSLGASTENKLTEMAETFASRTNFLHLRNVITESDGSFYEANHLEGNADMFEVMRCFLKEQKRRVEQNHPLPSIPFRPDHGHLMLDDLNKTTNPGYSAIGRLRGLAELRGLMLGIKRSLNL
jgi:mannonate dehydratase